MTGFFWFLFVCALITIVIYAGHLIYKSIRYHCLYKKYIKQIEEGKSEYNRFPDYEIAFMPLKMIRTLYRLNPSRWKYSSIRRGASGYPYYTDDYYITYRESNTANAQIYVIFTPTSLGFRIFLHLCKKYEKNQKKKAKRDKITHYNTNLMKILKVAQNDIDNIQITVAKQRKECADTVVEIQKRLKDSERKS